MKTFADFEAGRHCGEGRAFREERAICPVEKGSEEKVMGHVAWLIQG
jgi:hypothetical protein